MCVKNHKKRINIILERLTNNRKEVIPVNSYSVLCPGSSRVQVAIRNMTCKEIKLKPKTSIARMSAANSVPNMFAPKSDRKDKNDSSNLIQEGNKLKMRPLDEEQQRKLMTKIDLTGIDSWEKADQDLVKQLFTDFG